MTRATDHLLSEKLGYAGFKKRFVEANCQKCPLSRSRTNIVFDRGNPAAKILIIGEAPGAEEDKAGLCFVGRAGRLLDKMMASIGVDTGRDTLITNVLKCRPPDNRVPTREEAESCLPFLEKQIELMSPRVIILLGATACRHVFPAMRAAFSSQVGALIPHPRFRIDCMPLFHPAYLLYDPRKRKDMWAHLKGLREMLIREKLIRETPIPEGELPPF